MAITRTAQIGDQLANPRTFTIGTVDHLYTQDIPEKGGCLEVAVTANGHMITGDCTNVTILAEQIPEGTRVRARIDHEWTGTVTRAAYLMGSIVAIDIDWDHQDGGAYSAAYCEVILA